MHQTNPLLDTFREKMKNTPQGALSYLTGSSIDKIKKLTGVEIEEIVDRLLEILVIADARLIGQTNRPGRRYSQSR